MSSPSLQPSPVLFIRPDGSWTTAMLCLVGVLPVGVLLGWPWGFGVLFLALFLATCLAVQDIAERDKQEIRYSILRPDDIVQEMREWEAALAESHEQSTQELLQTLDRTKARLVSETGMTALAKKCGQQLEQSLPKDDNLALLCQEAAYISLRLFRKDDAMTGSALSVLALVAKNEQTRQRHLVQDAYHLSLPIQAMRESLRESQAQSIQEEDSDMEQQAAELQRKGCLLLGALSDGHDALGQLIVKNQGLEAIIDAVQWFRYHGDVVNWGLWALFQLCYENLMHKCALLQLNGVPLIIAGIRNCPEDMLVARHGIALLFDLMREMDDQECHGGPRVDVWLVRKQALDAGMHEALVAAMDQHSTVMDIMMMGAEILAGTDYKGVIPQFVPTDTT